MTLLQQTTSAIGGGGLWFELLRTLLALAFVCALCVISLRLLARRGFARGAFAPHASFAVLRRLALEPRKHLYLVRAGKRVLLIATGETGAPRLIAELDPAEFDDADAAVAVVKTGEPHA